jgi:hypothetical protein
MPMNEVDAKLKLQSGAWFRDRDKTTLCFQLTKGTSEITFG